jgi:bifunctional DNA-binding transcriptional regulator/antitoxin component of YhaV-PrlF toxin-antitoxin module
MLAKLTSKNQLTLPKAATEAVGAGEYFEVDVRAGQIVLTPVRLQRADAVRAKLGELAIDAKDVADAVAWARGSAAPAGLRVTEPDGPADAAAAPGPTARKTRKPRP